MKFIVTCSTCFTKYMKIHTSDFFGKVNFLVPYNDSGRYDVLCNEGHEITCFLNTPLFELLFDIGSNAIVDGYYREAISSYASSLERFYEYFVKIISDKNSISSTDLLTTWKLVAKQSERQLGAYIFSYLNEFKKIPPTLNNDITRLRNNVIHQGQIPKKNEAIEFGQEILKIIIPTYKILIEDYAQSLTSLNNDYFNKNIEPLFNKNKSFAIVPTSTLINQILISNESNLEKLIEQLIINRNSISSN